MWKDDLVTTRIFLTRDKPKHIKHFFPEITNTLVLWRQSKFIFRGDFYRVDSLWAYSNKNFRPGIFIAVALARPGIDATALVYF